MCNKAIELSAANQKLSELIEKLQVVEREYDKAVEHSANYLGNDDRIEEVRDDKARSILESVISVKAEIECQTKVVQELVSKY